MPASPTPCDAGVVHGAAPAPCSARQARWVLITTILGSGLTFLDSAGVGVALPVIQRQLHGSMADMQMVEGGYALLLAALMLVGGSLGDRYGRRRVFVIGVVLFMLASLGCALAPSMRLLIVARAAQGIGGACMVPGSLALLSSAFSGEQRSRAIGIWSGYTALLAAVGPLLAGGILHVASWRWIFLINAPLAVLVIVLCQTHVPDSKAAEQGPLDVRGAVLATAGLAAVALALIAMTWAQPGPVPALAGAAGAALLVGFVLAERASPNPMIPLSLFRSPSFAGANGLTLLLYLGFNATLFLLPFNLVGVQGYSPLAAGAALLPLILIMFTLSRWSGGLVGRYGPTLPLVVGPVLCAAGFGLLTLSGVGGSYFTSYFPGIVVLGFGMTISVAPLTTVVMDAVDASRTGLASGVNNTVSGTASMLAIATVGVLLAPLFGPELHRRLAGVPPAARHAIEAQRARLTAIELPEGLAPGVASHIKDAIAHAFVRGFHGSTLLSAGLALAAAAVAALTIRRRAG